MPFHSFTSFENSLAAWEMRGSIDANGDVEGDGVAETLEGRVELGNLNTTHVTQLVFKRQVVEERFRRRCGLQKRVPKNGLQLVNGFEDLNDYQRAKDERGRARLVFATPMRSRMIVTD